MRRLALAESLEVETIAVGSLEAKPKYALRLDVVAGGPYCTTASGGVRST
jgi:hypothetical protein